MSQSYPPPPPAYSSGEYQDPDAVPPRSATGRGPLIAVALVAIVFLGVALLCCGGVGAFFWFGSNVFAKQVEAEIRDNPVIREHIGEVRKLDVKWIDSAAAEGSDEFVFDIEGEKGRGTVTVESVTVDADTEEVRSGTLRMESGETYDLFPQ